MFRNAVRALIQYFSEPYYDDQTSSDLNSLFARRPEMSDLVKKGKSTIFQFHVIFANKC